MGVVIPLQAKERARSVLLGAELHSEDCDYEPSKAEECFECQGSGECQACNGTGECSDCEGKGEITSEEDAYDN